MGCSSLRGKTSIVYTITRLKKHRMEGKIELPGLRGRGWTKRGGGGVWITKATVEETLESPLSVELIIRKGEIFFGAGYSI
jgi:hypothetical protein